MHATWRDRITGYILPLALKIHRYLLDGIFKLEMSQADPQDQYQWWSRHILKDRHWLKWNRSKSAPFLFNWTLNVFCLNLSALTCFPSQPGFAVLLSGGEENELESANFTNDWQLIWTHQGVQILMFLKCMDSPNSIYHQQMSV